MIADRIRNLWNLERGLELKEERIKRLEAKALYPSVLDKEQNMEQNTINYMLALKKLYQDYDRLYQEIAYLDEVINSLQDDLQREVMQARFICHKKVEEVGKQFWRSKRSIQKITAKAFAELSKRYD